MCVYLTIIARARLVHELTTNEARSDDTKQMPRNHSSKNTDKPSARKYVDRINITTCCKLQNVIEAKRIQVFDSVFRF